MGTIEVKNLGKAYKVYPNRWSRLLEWIIPFGRQRHTLHWVLKDLNFTVAPGEAVGIIGINGAGKSTLLKLITGTAVPTTGEVKISGRVAALLELGMGFHPDFTGRQNVLMAGQLLGYTSDELIDLMPSIEEFADIGHYIDQPVRVYSSGMQMRLAFSLATAKRPDVLIVDEALSVGDAFYQHKSFDRIRKFREQGTTLLIVSHDKAAIQSICDQAILLGSGKILMINEPSAVMDFYNAKLADNQTQIINQFNTKNGQLSTVSGTGEVKTISLEINNLDSSNIPIVSVGEKINLTIIAEISADIDNLVFGFSIKDRLGQVLYGTNTKHLNQEVKNLRVGDKISYRVSFSANFGEGTYSVQTAFVSTDSHLVNNYEWKDNAIVFNVINKDLEKFIGSMWIQPKVEIYSL